MILNPAERGEGAGKEHAAHHQHTDISHGAAHFFEEGMAFIHRFRKARLPQHRQIADHEGHHKSQHRGRHNGQGDRLLHQGAAADDEDQGQHRQNGMVVMHASPLGSGTGTGIPSFFFFRHFATKPL